MNCDRADLVFSDYSWPGVPPAQASFDRRDGFQMLAVLNDWAASWSFHQTASFISNLERVIRQLVPRRCSTPADVRDWVEAHTPIL